MIIRKESTGFSVNVFLHRFASHINRKHKFPFILRKKILAQETELRVEGNSMREETIAGFQQEEIPSNREAAAVQQFSLPHTPSGDEVPQNSNSLQSASPVLLPEI